MAAWLLGGDGQGPFKIHRLRFFRIYVEIPNNINIEMSAFRDTLHQNWSAICPSILSPNEHCTHYTVHPVHSTPTTQYTHYTVHPLQSTPSTQYTQYIPATQYTHFKEHPLNSVDQLQSCI